MMTDWPGHNLNSPADTSVRFELFKLLVLLLLLLLLLRGSNSSSPHAS